MKESSKEMDTMTVKPIFGFVIRFTIIHFVTYVVFGLIFMTLLNYHVLYMLPEIAIFMRPTTSIWVLAGPLFQLIRGPIMALAIYPFRKVILDNRRGWILLWGLFVALAILSPAGAAPCSIEGIVYSVLPLWFHLIGLPEILLQTLALSFLFYVWEQNPEEKKISIPLIIVFSVLLVMVVWGLILAI